MVYVISIEGKPLMPCKEAKARHLLRDGKARVVRKEPFTVQLLFSCDNIIQDVTLGVDTGSKHVGLSVVSDKQELFSAEVELRDEHQKITLPEGIRVIREVTGEEAYSNHFLAQIKKAD